MRLYIQQPSAYGIGASTHSRLEDEPHREYPDGSTNTITRLHKGICQTPLIGCVSRGTMTTEEQDSREERHKEGMHMEKEEQFHPRSYHQENGGSRI
jgi:hypothetical protein